jgi:hypothetical protein
VGEEVADHDQPTDRHQRLQHDARPSRLPGPRQ